MTMTIAVIDYGMGNLHSIAKALEFVAPSARVQITDDPNQLRSADRLVFPGQGAIGHCMEKLHQRGLNTLIPELAASKPLLGICLGLQALLDFSDENGGTPALAWARGQIRRFPEDASETPGGARLRIPHMGWNQITPTRPHPLWEGIEPSAWFYFVHSYYAPADLAETAATTNYGVRFSCALARGNVFAVQFHPEKSHHAGLRLLANFTQWNGDHCSS